MTISPPLARRDAFEIEPGDQLIKGLAGRLRSLYAMTNSVLRLPYSLGLLGRNWIVANVFSNNRMLKYLAEGNW